MIAFLQVGCPSRRQAWPSSRRSRSEPRRSRLDLGLFEAKIRLRDRGVHDARLLDAELDLTGLRVLADRLARRPWSPSRPSGWASGHAGPSTRPRRPTTAHHVGGGDGLVEVEPAAGDLLGDVVSAHENRRQRPRPPWPSRPWRRPGPSIVLAGTVREGPPRRGPSGRRDLRVNAQPLIASSTVSSNLVWWDTSFRIDAWPRPGCSVGCLIDLGGELPLCFFPFCHCDAPFGERTCARLTPV